MAEGELESRFQLAIITLFRKFLLTQNHFILVYFFQALDKKGIGHLGEKQLKERNKCIQEENRRELQKVRFVAWLLLMTV